MRATVRRRAQAGILAQAIETSCAGRTSTFHTLTDATGRVRILLITVGNTSDMTMAFPLIEAAAGRFDRLIADCGYDGNVISAALPASRPI